MDSAEADHGRLISRVRERMVAGNGSIVQLSALVRDESSVLVDEAVLAELSQSVAAELSGAGPLDALMALEGATDVLVNAPSEVWLDRGQGLERAPVSFADEAAVRRLAQRLASAAGRRLDDSVPFVDAALPDGTRLHAVIPPVSPHTTISLRVLARRRFELSELVEPDVAALLGAIVAARLAVLISGGTGTGKTTLLGALLARAAPTERLLIIEDAREIVVDHPHVVRLLCRAANVEGGGAIELRDLVRQSLRMRPDRIIVGEFRGAEMAELLIALNTGHDGGAATLHANSALEVPARLVALGALAGMSPATVSAQVASAIDVVIHLRRDGLRRRVQTISLLERTGPDLIAVPVWSAALVGQPGQPGQPGQLGTVHPAGGQRLSLLLAGRGVAAPELIR